MTNYYFLSTRLPSLKFEEPLDITFRELMTLMKDNLTTRDLKKTQVIRRFRDIQNIQSFWLNEELTPYGNLDAIELEEALLVGVGLPDYVYAFMEKYEKKEDRLYHFPELISTYFQVEAQGADRFIKEYLEFEREMRLVLVGFRAKKLGRNLEKELQFENPDDPVVYQILAQKDAPSYEPPEKFAALKPIFDQYGNDPLSLHLALLKYRFNLIEEKLEFDMFSIDRILGYMIQLTLVEMWQKLDKQKGKEILDIIVKEAI